MRIHRNAKLTPGGRAAMIDRLNEGWKAERFIQTMLLGWAYKHPVSNFQAPHLGTGAVAGTHT